MAIHTKKALKESLKKQLHCKRFDKITISDITNGCGMNRMTFYYHFSDIYDLMVWWIENYLRGLCRERQDSKDCNPSKSSTPYPLAAARVTKSITSSAPNSATVPSPSA